MTVQDDRMWADVLDAHTPNAAEMAEAEAELQALGEVAPLPAEDVEALVEVAVKTPSVVVEGRGVIGTVLRSRRFQQPLLRAAAAVLLLMAAAWVARELLWPEERDWTSSSLSDYAAAIELAQQQRRSDDVYRGAMGHIVAECGKAAETLRSLANQDKYPTLREEALKVSAELVALLRNGPNAPSGLIDRSLIETAANAENEQLGVEVREMELNHVRDLAKSGLTAMWLAPLAGDEAKQMRVGLFAKLLGTLPQRR